MLLNVYAKELPEIHFTALAPGVIRTPMVQHIIDKVDDTIFPSAKQLKEWSYTNTSGSSQTSHSLFSLNC